ncbi:DMT family transporter [Chromobacterium sp. IIBBL 290-4]|uniref:DMT family transporter n=1 Tax=Chromobacterium sp. IIBBL 290-4 TaxID=2953890 RepID=UPI0020B6462C|nr:DMT family transporter [Chromobacterium sp. IIBBL 290-4]UTH74920.1 DMT family transporter [Chromobacterium sp. IIBBL 290-4]
MPYLALTLAMFLWSSAFIVLKYVFEFYSPLAVLFARMAIACLCLLPLAMGGRISWRYRKGDWPWLLAMGLAEPCLYFLFEANALTLTSASQAGVVTATLPMLMAIGARVFLGERQPAQTWCGIALSFAGVIWLSLDTQAGLGSPDPSLGNLLEFCAMVCACGYVLIAKRMSTRYSPLAITGIQTVTGCVWFGLAMLTPWGHWPSQLHLLPSLWVVYLGAVITLGAYGLYTWAVSRIPVARAGAFNNLIPVFTVLLAWLLLNEQFQPWQGAAGALVFAGVWLSQRRAA